MEGPAAVRGGAQLQALQGAVGHGGRHGGEDDVEAGHAAVGGDAQAAGRVRRQVQGELGQGGRRAVGEGFPQGGTEADRAGQVGLGQALLRNVQSMAPEPGRQVPGRGEFVGGDVLFPVPA